MPMIARPEIVDEVHYPSGDGQPMAETPIHVDSIILLKQALDDFLQSRPDMYVGANMFWYWERGNKSACRAPDAMVIPGVGRADRPSFMSWRENGAVPSVIFEIVSASSWESDLEDKGPLYQGLGVAEYFLFDPEALYLHPNFRGFRTNGDEYRELKARKDGSLISRELGLRIVPEGNRLRLIDLATGERILTREERVSEERRLAEKERLRADEAVHRVDEMAAEIARLRALLKDSTDDAKGNR